MKSNLTLSAHVSEHVQWSSQYHFQCSFFSYFYLSILIQLFFDVIDSYDKLLFLNNLPFFFSPVHLNSRDWSGLLISLHPSSFCLLLNIYQDLNNTSLIFLFKSLHFLFLAFSWFTVSHLFTNQYICCKTGDVSDYPVCFSCYVNKIANSTKTNIAK